MRSTWRSMSNIFREQCPYHMLCSNRPCSILSALKTSDGEEWGKCIVLRSFNILQNGHINSMRDVSEYIHKYLSNHNHRHHYPFLIEKNFVDICTSEGNYSNFNLYVQTTFPTICVFVWPMFFWEMLIFQFTSHLSGLSASVYRLCGRNNVTFAACHICTDSV